MQISTAKAVSGKSTAQRVPEAWYAWGFRVESMRSNAINISKHDASNVEWKLRGNCFHHIFSNGTAWCYDTSITNVTNKACWQPNVSHPNNRWRYHLAFFMYSRVHCAVNILSVNRRSLLLLLTTPWFIVFIRERDIVLHFTHYLASMSEGERLREMKRRRLILRALDGISHLATLPRFSSWWTIRYQWKNGKVATHLPLTSHKYGKMPWIRWKRPRTMKHSTLTSILTLLITTTDVCMRVTPTTPGIPAVRKWIFKIILLYLTRFWACLERDCSDRMLIDARSSYNCKSKRSCSLLISDRPLCLMSGASYILLMFCLKPLKISQSFNL